MQLTRMRALIAMEVFPITLLTVLRAIDSRGAARALLCLSDLVSLDRVEPIALIFININVQAVK